MISNMKNKSTIALIVLSFIAFISLGLPDGLLGVAWPGIRDSFKLSIDAIGFLLIFSTGGYMLSSFFSGILVRRLGIGGLLSLSCAATAAALLIYSITPFWWIFVIAASLGGLGAGAIDAGINNYVEKNHSERMMQWLHASFGVGITMGPVIMTLGITLTGKWQIGYILVSMAQFVLALTFFITKGKWKSVSTVDEKNQHIEGVASMRETLGKLSALLSMLMFFIYVGVELGLGLWAYSLLTISRNVDPAIAGFITGSYWAMFTLGRIFAGLYARRFTSRTILNFSIFSAIAGAVLLSLNLGTLITVLAIAIVGFSIAPIFPSLISDTGNRVGVRHTSNTIGMQISAAGFGAAVVPSIAGVLARIYSLEIIPFYLLGALVLLFISFSLSHRQKRS